MYKGASNYKIKKFDLHFHLALNVLRQPLLTDDDLVQGVEAAILETML
jgi:hypothetical protein